MHASPTDSIWGIWNTPRIAGLVNGLQMHDVNTSVPSLDNCLVLDDTGAPESAH